MAGKIRKTAGVLLLIAAVLFSQLPSGSASAKSSDFQTNGNVLVKYTGTDKEVTIPSHITVIGEDAFFENTTLERIEIPEGVEEIRHHAFYGCSNLKEIRVPDSVEIIGNAAFAECDLLTDMAIGNGIRDMGNGVFSGCPLLSDIELAENHPTLCCESGALMNADKTYLYEVLNGSNSSVFDMPDTIETIAKYAFWGCGNLQVIELSGSLTEIPAYSFSNCRGLQAVTIPYSVSRIGAKAFENCSNLQAVEIPETVKRIHESAFDGCSQLQIKAVAGTVADQFAREHVVTAISQTEYEEILESVYAQQQDDVDRAETGGEAGEETDDAEEDGEETDTSEEDNTETDEVISDDTDTEDESVVLPTDEDVMGRTVIVSGQAVVFIDNTQQAVYSGEPTVPTQIPDEQGDIADVSGTVNGDEDGETPDAQIQEELAQKGLSIPKYTIVNGTLIADQAYYSRTGMDSYEFPDGITEIGEFAFARSGLSEIVIPEGITTIGYGAFYHCDSLKEVSIPDSVEQIAPYAFAQTPWLESWKTETGEDFLIVGDGILLAYRGSDSRIVIPDGVKSIAPECFAGHMGIISVTFPASVAQIGEDAFAGCVNLSSLKGGDGIRKIADRAFAGCPLTMVTIGTTVEEIGAMAFDLSGTVRADDMAAIWFLGEDNQTLPEVSYEESATRYYNAKNRDICFNGMNVAIVPGSSTVLEGTVLDPYESGFRGYICTWDENTTEGEETLVILKCTLPLEDTTQIVWPVQFVIGGSTYPVTSVAENALSYYENPDWLVSETADDGTIDLSLRSTFLVRPELAEARLDGNEENIQVVITDDLFKEEQIRECYEAIYGRSDGVYFQGFEITAEGMAGIPLTSFGSNALELTVALPQEFQNRQVYVVCLDRNGQLEVVRSEQMVIKQVPYLRFYAKHLSPYAILWFEGGTLTLGGSGNLDESPNTGDFFEPKWLLCIGTAAVAFVLILWKEPRKKKQTK